MRLGVLGGTFDPIHHGHLVAGLWALDSLALDRVLFVPTGDPWQKSDDRRISQASHRMEMTRLAIAREPRFSLSTVDVDRGGATYAVDTLADLHKLFPEAELNFIVGADALNGIFSWREPERLFELARFVACTRPGVPLAEQVVAQIPPDRLILLEIPEVEVSSTLLRERAGRGQSLRFLVPDAVVDYVAQHKLYQERDL